MTITTAFPSNLRRAIYGKKLTQSELARRIDTSRQVISDYVQGVTLPSLDTFVKICMVLEVSPEILLADGGPYWDQEVKA